MTPSLLQTYLEFISFGFLSALLISFLLTPAVMKLGFVLNIVDQPGERRIHKLPTPRCGGLAVFISYTSTLILLNFLLNFSLIADQTKDWVQSVISVSIPLILLGLLDDRWEIKPIFKLLGQILIGFLAWEQELNLGKLLGTYMPPVIDACATIFLYTAAMNAYNLIDGMDGVAGGLGAITSLGLGALNLILGNEAMAVMCFALTGACLGFLRYNFYPARIFLGDTGSMYIGFILMSLTLVAQSRTTAAIMLIIPLLTMGVPLIDTGLAIWRRSVRRAMNPADKYRVSVADKDHLHHRLARKGFTQRRVAVTLYAIQVILFIVGLLWVFMQNYRIAIFTVAFFAGSYVVLRYLASLEMTDSGRWIVDGIRRPGRLQLYSSFMPFIDVIILSLSLLFLSWLLYPEFPELRLGQLIRETAPPLIGSPLILLWATRHYRIQWTRARALDFLSLGFVIIAGLLIGIAITPISFKHSLRDILLIAMVLLGSATPLMVFCRAFPRLVQDMLQYHDRKKKYIDNRLQHRVIIYGAGYGYTLITRAESFDDSSRKNNYCLVGLIDDNPYLRNRLVHGHTVLGSLSDLARLVQKYDINEVLISTDLNTVNEKRLLKIASELDLRVSQRIFTQRTLKDSPDKNA